MKIMVFSDLHASSQSLEDVRDIISQVDLSIFCGDILGYGQDIDVCLDFIFEEVDLVVMGNHDRMSISNENLNKQHPMVRESIFYTRKNLSPEGKEKLSQLKTEVLFNKLFIIHSLGDDYLRSRKDFIRLVEYAPSESKFIFFGHTHERVHFKYGEKTLINPGSITKGRKGHKRGYVLIEDDLIEFVDLEDIL